MSERLRSASILALALTAGLAAAQPSLAQTPGRVQVRLSGAELAEPVMADYLGGLASFNEVVEEAVGGIRVPGTGLGPLRVTNVNLRRVHVDNVLAQWRKKAADGTADYRREVVLEFVAPGGTTLARFRLVAAWLSSYSIAGSLATTVPGTAGNPPRTVGVEAFTLVFDSFVREQ